MTRFPPLVREAPLLAAALALAWFYAWTASGGWPFEMGGAPDSHYNLLAQALLRGQLHLTVEPDPALLEMSEPY